MNKKYTIITTCNRFPTEPYYCLQEYLKSLQGEEVIMLTEDFGGKWGGLSSKPKWLYKAIIEGWIKTEYIIFTDCWDFVFAEHPQKMFELYISLTEGKYIVISTEKNCFPDDLKKEFDEAAKMVNKDINYKYINSGLIIGKTQDIKRCLEAMKVEELPNDYFDGEKNVHPNDQYEWMKVWNEFKDAFFFLDYMQQFSCTLHNSSVSDLDFSNEKIRLKETDRYPLSFHMNGSGKTSGVRNPILKHLKLL